MVFTLTGRSSFLNAGKAHPAKASQQPDRLKAGTRATSAHNGDSSQTQASPADTWSRRSLLTAGGLAAGGLLAHGAQAKTAPQPWTERADSEPIRVLETANPRTLKKILALLPFHAAEVAGKSSRESVNALLAKAAALQKQAMELRDAGYETEPVVFTRPGLGTRVEKASEAWEAIDVANWALLSATGAGLTGLMLRGAPKEPFGNYIQMKRMIQAGLAGGLALVGMNGSHALVDRLSQLDDGPPVFARPAAARQSLRLLGGLENAARKLRRDNPDAPVQVGFLYGKPGQPKVDLYPAYALPKP